MSLDVLTFDAVPAMCVRIGRFVERMVQADAIEFDRALDGLPERYPLHEDLANRILERGLEGVDRVAADHPVGAWMAMRRQSRITSLLTGRSKSSRLRTARVVDSS